MKNAMELILNLTFCLSRLFPNKPLFYNWLNNNIKPKQRIAGAKKCLNQRTGLVGAIDVRHLILTAAPSSIGMLTSA